MYLERETIVHTVRLKHRTAVSVVQTSVEMSVVVVKR
jgi:hypothetical protein